MVLQQVIYFTVRNFIHGKDITICHHQIKKNPYIIKNIHLVYNLAKVTLCLGETEEGIDHLQKASDNGHIPATSLLGDYYKTDYTFFFFRKNK